MVLKKSMKNIKTNKEIQILDAELPSVHFASNRNGPEKLSGLYLSQEPAYFVFLLKVSWQY